MSRIALLLAAAALTAAPAASHAQARGRTDGPEGSEIGKGGYEDPSGGRFSLTLNWGAALSTPAPLGGTNGPPLFFGGTFGFWGSDWFVVEASGFYVLQNGNLDLLVGPRFRTGFYPISASVGLKAGAVIVPDEGLRFGLSPELGADLLLDDKWLLGLGYAIDLPIGSRATTHRLFMNIGYRF